MYTIVLFLNFGSVILRTIKYLCSFLKYDKYLVLFRHPNAFTLSPSFFHTTVSLVVLGAMSEGWSMEGWPANPSMFFQFRSDLFICLFPDNFSDTQYLK